jgi:hypothetical protein
MHQDARRARREEVDVRRGRPLRSTWRGSHLYAPQETADEYSCPVCGIGLAQSNFDTPERDYYCPFCTTRQAPVRRLGNMADPLRNASS